MNPNQTEGVFSNVLKTKQFGLTTEMAPPKSADTAPILKKAALFKGKVHACNVTDNQLAIARMSALATSAILVQQGLDPILQITCRDLNRLALQSHLLGAWALGVRAVMCLSGDHPKFGNHPDAKAVYDLNVFDLIRLVKKFRDEGKFLNGEEIRHNKTSDIVNPRFVIGAAANPFQSKPEAAIKRLEQKIDAGADFFQTQPIFDLEAFQAWFSAVKQAGLPARAAFLAGVMPIKSAQGLRYMKANVPGSSVPDALIQRMETSAHPEEEGILIACEMVEKLKKVSGLAGIHLMSVGWESALLKVIEKTGLHI